MRFKTPVFVCIVAVVLSACSGGEKKAETIPGQKNPEPVADASTSVENGKALFTVCIQCHGENAEGIDSLNAPRLTGLQDWYLKRQIEHFQKGIRGNNPEDTQAYQMAAMSKTLSDETKINDVVAYIKTLNNPPYEWNNLGDLENGKKYYQMVCGTCHGPEGEGNDALNSPNLRDISLGYLNRQYVAFMEGRRGTHADDVYGSQMQMMSNTVPDLESVRDIFAYIHSLNGTTE